MRQLYLVFLCFLLSGFILGCGGNSDPEPEKGKEGDKTGNLENNPGSDNANKGIKNAQPPYTLKFELACRFKIDILGKYAFAPDNAHFFALESKNNNLFLKKYHLKNKQLATEPIHLGDAIIVEGTTFSADGRKAAVIVFANNSQERVGIVDTETGRITQRIDPKQDATYVAISGNGKVVVVSALKDNSKSQLSLFDTGSGKLLAKIESDKTDLKNLSMSRTGDVVFLPPMLGDTWYTVWDTKSNKIRKLISLEEPTNAVISPDGKTIAGTWIHQFRSVLGIVDVGTGKTGKTISDKRVANLQYSPNSQRLFASKIFKGMCMFDLVTAAEVADSGPKENFFGPVFSPNGEYLAVGKLSTDPNLKQDDIYVWKLVKQ